MFTFCIHFGVYMIDDPQIPVSVMCGRANSALRTSREDLTRTVAYFDESLLQKILTEQTVIGSFEKVLNGRALRRPCACLPESARAQSLFSVYFAD